MAAMTMREQTTEHGGAIELFAERGPCPLCGCRESTVLHDFDRIPVRKCAGCGFIHSGRIMTAEGMKRYYAETFGSERHRQGQVVNAEVNIRALRRLLDLKSVKSFLDVGTGYGYLMKKLRDQYGIRCVGAELSAQEAEYGIKHLGLDIRPCLLSEAGLEPGSFDVVSCHEVIEHVPDPIPFVAEMARYARPGGYVLVNTDNFESRTVHKMGAEFPKWIPHSHVSHFAPGTLTRCVESVAGLRVVKTLSYTTWENALRATLMRRAPRPAPEAFDLDRALKTEMGGRYPLFGVRKFMNKAWFSLRYRNDLEGAMMYVLAQKAG